MLPERLDRLSQRVFLVAALTVPLAFSTRSFEAFHTLKAFLASSLLWLCSLLFFGSTLLGSARLPRSPLAYSLAALTAVLFVSSRSSGRLAEAAFSFCALVPFALGLIFLASACASAAFRRASAFLFLFAAGLSAAYGLLQYLDLDPINPIYRGWIGLLKSFEPGRLSPFWAGLLDAQDLDPNAPVQDLWVRTEGKRGIFSTFGNPNFLAEFLVLCFPLGLAARLAARSVPVRALLLRLLILFSIAIAACGARGVWLALALSTLGFAALTSWLCPGYRRPLLRTLAGVLLAGAVGTGLLAAFGGSDAESLAARLRLVGGDLGVSGRARLLAWRIALEDMIPRSALYEALLRLGSYRLPQEAPRPAGSSWLGSGLSSFILDFLPARDRHFSRLKSQEHLELLPALNYDRLHNEYLQVLVEGGLISLGLVAATLIGIAGAFLRRIRQDSERERLDRIAALCCGIGPAVHAGFSFPAHLAPTALGLIYATGCVLAGREATAPLRPRAPALPVLVALFLLGPLGVGVLLRPFLADVARKEVESTESGQTLEIDAATVEAGLRLEPLNGPLHFALAKKAYAARDYATAEREAAAALRGIDDVAIHTLLGVACLSQGKNAEARRHLADAAAMSAGDPAALYFQALAAAAAGDRLDALRLLERLQQRSPGHVEAWMLRGDLHARSGAFAEAERCFTEAASAAPDNAKAWFLLAVVRRELGRLDEARSALDRSLALDPHEPRAQALLRLLEAGRPERP
jgi:Flp pilus assembly protein TadD